MNKFCPNCGHPVKKTDKVCGNCGKPLTQSNSSKLPTKNEESLRRGTTNPTKKKKHSIFKWVIGIGVIALLAEGGYLIYENMVDSNNSAMTATKKSSSATSSNSAKSTSTEKKSSHENTTSNNNEANHSKSDNNESGTVANIDPQTLAATILLLGGQKSEVWKNLTTQDSLEVNVIQASSTDNNYSEPGTGVSYMFTSEGKNYGEVLEYRLSSDGSTVYCYQQPERDSATRHVTPFATLSAKEIQQAQDNSTVKALAAKMEVKSGEN